ncbi:MAG: efflux RND transporter periplasmic adaptor subunit [Pacificimonas sp.]
MTRKTLAVATGLLIAIVAAVFLFWPNDEPEPVAEEAHSEAEAPEGFIEIDAERMRAANIQVEMVGRGSSVELVFPATVAASPSSSARIDARASGVVRSISKTLGDTVRQGETIARIESAEAATLASQLSASRARVEELRANYEREQRLFDENVTARQDLEAVRANLRVAESDLSRAQAAVAAAGVSGNGRSLAVTSPLTGRVTAAPIVLGSFVAAGDELYRVVDPRDMQVEVALPSAEATRVQPGDEAILELPGGREERARVRSVTPALDMDSRSATAVLKLARPIAELQPGAFLQARILPSEEIDRDRVSIPEAAVQTLDGRETVFVRTNAGFQARPVITGSRSSGRVTIESGLEPGLEIATENAFLLKAELEKEGAEHGH